MCKKILSLLIMISMGITLFSGCIENVNDPINNQKTYTIITKI